MEGIEEQSLSLKNFQAFKENSSKHMITMRRKAAISMYYAYCRCRTCGEGAEGTFIPQQWQNPCLSHTLNQVPEDKMVLPQ